MFAGVGKHYRKGISLVELAEMFSTEKKAEDFFIEARYPDGLRCPRCDSDKVSRRKNRKPMPFHCKSCRKYFSMKTGTIMHDSKLSLRTWGIAFYLMTTNVKGVSSMKIMRDLGITYQTAWHLTHRIRETWRDEIHKYGGPVEVDETYIGGKKKNKSLSKRRDMAASGVPASPFEDKTAVVGLKDRSTNYVTAAVVEDTKGETLRDFVHERTDRNTVVFTDESNAYNRLRRPHGTVNHSIEEYVDGEISTNGVESFWSLLKRGYVGTYHQMSAKHLHRYVNEFSGRHNQRPLDTRDQMLEMAKGTVGKRLTFEDLIGPRHTRQPRML